MLRKSAFRRRRRSDIPYGHGDAVATTERSAAAAAVEAVGENIDQRSHPQRVTSDAAAAAGVVGRSANYNNNCRRFQQDSSWKKKKKNSDPNRNHHRCCRQGYRLYWHRPLGAPQGTFRLTVETTDKRIASPHWALPVSLSDALDSIVSDLSSGALADSINDEDDDDIRLELQFAGHPSAWRERLSRADWNDLCEAFGRGLRFRRSGRGGIVESLITQLPSKHGVLFYDGIQDWQRCMFLQSVDARSIASVEIVSLDGAGCGDRLDRTLLELGRRCQFLEELRIEAGGGMHGRPLDGKESTSLAIAVRRLSRLRSFHCRNTKFESRRDWMLVLDGLEESVSLEEIRFCEEDVTWNQDDVDGGSNGHDDDDPNGLRGSKLVPHTSDRHRRDSAVVNRGTAHSVTTISRNDNDNNSDAESSSSSSETDNLKAAMEELRTYLNWNAKLNRTFRLLSEERQRKWHEKQQQQMVQSMISPSRRDDYSGSDGDCAIDAAAIVVLKSWYRSTHRPSQMLLDWKIPQTTSSKRNKNSGNSETTV